MRSVDVIKRMTSLPFQKVNDETLVVDTKTREVHLLNATATRVWELLEAPRTVDDLVGALGREFDAPEATLRDDVASLLADLGAKGLIDGDNWRKADR
jgi:hypothetical protein